MLSVGRKLSGAAIRDDRQTLGTPTGPTGVTAESGQIYLLKSALWVDEFIGEHVRFKGEGDDHDDQVDMLSYAVQSMSAMVDVPRMIEGTGYQHGWMYGAGRR